MQEETFDPSQREGGQRVLAKLEWLSGVLSEVDDWLDSRRLVVRNSVEAREHSVISLENIDAFIARESR
ncbi:MAG TPA: hypothetical protein VFD71_04605 [Planctomycetota bacterium]|jgi:hypothetical protein|nr:hypothetical protein [Planctomycetota bacterium]